eukprot:scaffold2357_cov399-Prasinococcus_capsulatus_cf.AAC.24
MPVSESHFPVPSMLMVTSTSVSLVLRCIVAVRSGGVPFADAQTQRRARREGTRESLKQGAHTPRAAGDAGPLLERASPALPRSMTAILTCRSERGVVGEVREPAKPSLAPVKEGSRERDRPAPSFLYASAAAPAPACLLSRRDADPSRPETSAAA